MAPFVKHEWGEAAYAVMREVKDIFDPTGILNPGVIFNDDPECYIKHFKPMPLTNDHVNKCIECGFCEVNCMSCGFSLSSRQRIVVQREISRLRHTGEAPKRLKRLEKLFKYYGNETCAGDGLCSTSCPMKINVADLIHDLRTEACPSGSLAFGTGRFAAQHFAAIKNGLRPLLSTATIAQTILGDNGVRIIGKTLHAFGLPLWTPSLPKARYAQPKSIGQSKKKVVYFPSCINQTMGTSRHDPKQRNLVDEVVAFLAKAGWEVIFPNDMERLCCGMIWESKGMPAIADQKAEELEHALWEASAEGRYPIICDQSPCLKRMNESMKHIKPQELISFIHDYVADSLQFIPTDEPVAIHLTCSTRRLGLNEKILALAHRCSTHVLVPEGVGCCGFAGDKGFTYPELNAYGLRKLRPQIEAAGIRRGFSNSRTCEIGLSEHSGIPYQSLVYLIDECTIPKVHE